jgi:hypothetical protein
MTKYYRRKLMPSLDMNVRDAAIKISEMASAEEINAFIEGDERKTVLDAAGAKMKELTSKQGEVKETITKDTHDFREGVQKTKNYITGEDVINNLRAKGVKI